MKIFGRLGSVRDAQESAESASSRYNIPFLTSMKAYPILTAVVALLAGCSRSPRSTPAVVSPAPVAPTTASVAVVTPVVQTSAPAAVTTPAPVSSAASASGSAVPPVAGGTSAAIPAAVPAPAVPGPAPLPAVPVIPELPKPAAEVVRLVESQMSEEVVIGYVDNIQEPFSLSADQVIHLRDVGVPMPVIEALVKRAGGTTAEGTAPAPTTAPPVAAIPGQPAPPSAGSPAVPNAPAAPAAGTVPSAPAVVYGDQQAAPAPAQTVVVQQPATQVTHTYFYDSLSPYGAWVNVDGYGWCWQPTVAVVQPGWRPYCHGGNWLWTDSGWYWYSDYSWGWAPFHYGRWHRHQRHGWVWHPGTVWGPAWVTWRQSEGYCGWAPLPPDAHWGVGVGLTYRGSHVSVGFGWGLSAWDYAFVPVGRFYDRHPYRHCIDRDHAERTIKNSTVINPTIVGNNNTVIINNGVSREMVQRHSREEIRKVSLQDSTTPVKPTERGSQGATSRPAAVAVYRPALPSQASAPPQQVLQRQEARRTPTVPQNNAVFLPSRSGTAPASGAASGIRPATPSRGEPSASTRPATPSTTGGRAAPATAARPATGATTGAPAGSAGSDNRGRQEAIRSSPAPSTSQPSRTTPSGATPQRPATTTSPAPDSEPRRSEPRRAAPPSTYSAPQRQEINRPAVSSGIAPAASPATTQYPGGRPASAPGSGSGLVEYRSAPSPSVSAPSRNEAYRPQGSSGGYQAPAQIYQNQRPAAQPAPQNYQQPYRSGQPAIRTEPSGVQRSSPPAQVYQAPARQGPPPANVQTRQPEGQRSAPPQRAEPSRSSNNNGGGRNQER